MKWLCKMGMRMLGRVHFWASLMLGVTAPSLASAANIVLSDSFDIPFDISFDEQPTAGFYQPVTLDIPTTAAGYIPGYDPNDPRLGGTAVAAIQRTTTLYVVGSGTITTLIQENSSCSVFFPCAPRSVDQTATLTVANAALGLKATAINTASFDVPSLPPLVQRSTSTSFSVTTTANAIKGDAAVTAAPGNYTFNVSIQLGDTATQSRKFTEIKGDIQGEIRGVVSTIVQTATPQQPLASTSAIVALALSNARGDLAKQGNANPTDVEIARQATYDAINLREQNASTSVDPSYRDAEYLLRGYTGGLLASDPSQFASTGDPSNDFADLTGPAGAAYHNLVKIKNDLLGLTNSSNSLPASSPGGMEANAFGFFAGLSGVSLEDLASSSSTYINPIVTPKTTPADPLLPKASPGPNLDDTRVNPNVFELDVSPHETVYFDPATANAYIFSVAGNEVADLTLPTDLGGPVDVQYGICSQRVAPGGVLVFQDSCSADGTGSDFGSFSITDVDLLNGDPLVLGLDFVEAGRVIVFEQALSIAAASAGPTSVPEPSSIVLCAAATLMGVGRRRPRRRSA